MAAFIPIFLRSNAAFREDLQSLLSLPVAALAELVAEIDINDPDEADALPLMDIGRTHDVEIESLNAAAVALVYLATQSHLADESSRPEEELRQIAVALEKKEDFDQRWPTLARILDREMPYQREAEARLAFRVGRAYKGVSLDVMLRPGKQGQLLAGFHWVISYSEPDGDVRAVSFEISEMDAEDLVDEIGNGLRKLAELREAGPLALSAPVRQNR